MDILHRLNKEDGRTIIMVTHNEMQALQTSRIIRFLMVVRSNKSRYNMYKQYFRQAWNLMTQNRFYSTVYIIGTGMAIAMVMVLAIVFHARTANIAPEIHRDRMLLVPGLQQ